MKIRRPKKKRGAPRSKHGKPKAKRPRASGRPALKPWTPPTSKTMRGMMIKIIYGVSDPIKKPPAAKVSLGKIPMDAKLYVAMSLEPHLFAPRPRRNLPSGSNRIRIERLRKETLAKADAMIRAFIRWEVGNVSNMTHDERLRQMKARARRRRAEGEESSRPS